MSSKQQTVKLAECILGLEREMNNIKEINKDIANLSEEHANKYRRALLDAKKVIETAVALMDMLDIVYEMNEREKIEKALKDCIIPNDRPLPEGSYF